MRRFAVLRLSLLMAVVGSVVLVGASQALADTHCDATNPQVRVCVAISPHVATNGTQVTIAEAIRNLTATAKTFIITHEIEGPNGFYRETSRQVTLRGGSSLRRTIRYVVDSSYPRGTYTVTISATNGHGTSSASHDLLIT